MSSTQKAFMHGREGGGRLGRESDRCWRRGRGVGTKPMYQHRQSPVTGGLRICILLLTGNPNKDLSCAALSPVPSMGLTNIAAPRETAHRCRVETHLCPCPDMTQQGP